MIKVVIALTGEDDSIRDAVFDWLKEAINAEVYDMDFETSDGTPATFDTYRVDGDTVTLEFIVEEEEPTDEEPA